MVRTINHIRAFFFCVILIIPFAVLGQDVGIKFESATSWKDMLAKAKSEHKYIFVDCFTTWCGPCKWMSKNIFPQKAAGDFFNVRFISMSLQMDQTKNDSQSVKDIYDEAKEFAAAYHVDAYPTFLFFSPDGSLVHRVVGANRTVDEFIGKAKQALDTNTQYYSRAANWSQHSHDSAFLRRLLHDAVDFGDTAVAIPVGEAYLKTQTNWLTKENILAVTNLERLKNSMDSKEFLFLVENNNAIDNILSETGFCAYEIGSTIHGNLVSPRFANSSFPVRYDSLIDWVKLNYPSVGQPLIDFLEHQFMIEVKFQIKRIANGVKDNQVVDWNWVGDQINAEINGYDTRLLLKQEEIDYYARKKLWDKCIQLSIELMEKFGDKAGQNKINEISFDYLFKHSDDKATLMLAAKWMKHYIELDSTKDECLDTYANLLYKLGEKDNAINWEAVAIRLAEKDKDFPEDVKEFRGTLTKMEQGLPTW